MKTFWSAFAAKILLALSAILGIIGLIMRAIGQLPPDFPLPPEVASFLAIIPLIINYLGWQDEFEGGQRGILDKIKAFFQNPYRKLLLTSALAALSGALNLPNLSGTFQDILAVVTAIVAALELGNSEAKLEQLRNFRAFAKMNGFSYNLK